MSQENQSNWLRINLMMCCAGERSDPSGVGAWGEEHFPGFRRLFESAQPGVIKEETPPGFSADRSD